MPAIKGKIHYFTEEISFTLKGKKTYTDWIKRTIEQEGKTAGEINYIFCSDAYLLDINITYLQHDTYTDIITFNNSEEGEISGDIFISIDRVKENSEKLNTPFSEELKRVVIHGILHLCGYKDKTKSESTLMRSKEDLHISQFA